LKEIIYLDTEIMNSMLAQLDEGLITSFSAEESVQENETEGIHSTRSKNAKASYLGLGVGGERRKMELESKTILEGQKDILNKTFDDYALDILSDKLVDQNLLNHGPDFKEGDLYLGESTYKFYDFQLIKNVLDYKLMESLMLSQIGEADLEYNEAIKIINKKNPNAREREQLPLAQQVIETHKNTKPIVAVFKQLETFSSYASKALGDVAVIKASNQIGLIKKRFLREAPEALSFRTDQSRQVKFLVRIIGEKRTVFNGFNLPELATQDIDKIPNLMIDILLGSFDIIQQGDFLVSPIAVYYE